MKTCKNCIFFIAKWAYKTLPIRNYCEKKKDYTSKETQSCCPNYEPKKETIKETK